MHESIPTVLQSAVPKVQTEREHGFFGVPVCSLIALAAPSLLVGKIAVGVGLVFWIAGSSRRKQMRLQSAALGALDVPTAALQTESDHDHTSESDLQEHVQESAPELEIAATPEAVPATLFCADHKASLTNVESVQSEAERSKEDAREVVGDLAPKRELAEPIASASEEESQQEEVEEESWVDLLYSQSGHALCLLAVEGDVLVMNQACERELEVLGLQASDNPWIALVTDTDMREGLVERCLAGESVQEEMDVEKLGRVQVSLTRVQNDNQEPVGVALAWTCVHAPELVEPEPVISGPDPEHQIALESLAEQASELVGAQERWIKQTENTRVLLEEAYQDWDLDPEDRKSWAEGSSRWRTLAKQCKSESTELRERIEEGLQSLQSMRELLKESAQAGQGVSGCQPVLLKFSDKANLLAFNATIEAAGAGEAGRGFARVASEVRDLAADTYRQGQEVGQQVDALQAVSGTLESAGQNLGSWIDRLNEICKGLDQDLTDQESQALQIVQQGCRQGDSAAELSRALQVVVEANRVQSSMARNLGQSMQLMVDSVGELLEPDTEDETPANLRIVA